LRDIKVCLAAQAGKFYHMGIGAAVACSTLASSPEVGSASLIRAPLAMGRSPFFKHKSNLKKERAD
jgi:hypothetical protein